MLNTSPMKHIGAYEFILVGILPVDYRVEQLKLGHMFNIMNDSAPSYLMDSVHLVQSQHSYSTRISELYLLRFQESALLVIALVCI